MVMLGLANSRMKDFYDIGAIAHTMRLDGNLLAQAIKATFERRKTEITAEALFVFSNEFIQDPGKNTQWNAFLKKNDLESGTDFSQAVNDIKQLLEPVYDFIVKKQSFEMQWLPETFQWK
jgi:hypothetical protein